MKSAKEIINEIHAIVKERDEWRAKAETLEKELENRRWQPIETFNNSMFSIMSVGIPDATEVVKYKGDVPEWARWWMPFPPLPRPKNIDNDGT